MWTEACAALFQSTLPVRGATSVPKLLFIPAQFQSTLPVRGATNSFCGNSGALKISIHAPCEGSDCPPGCSPAFSPGFQSTLPVRGATHQRSLHWNARPKFQSTLPVRGATALYLFQPRIDTVFQSTLPVRGATGSSVSPGYHLRISIHAPCEGSDGKRVRVWAVPARISIHAPCEGSDGARSIFLSGRRDFNPRSL